MTNITPLAIAYYTYLVSTLESTFNISWHKIKLQLILVREKLAKSKTVVKEEVVVGD